MPRLYDKLVIAAFVAATCVPVVAKLAGVHDLPVYGALPRLPHPKLSLAGLRNESYQTDYTAWFERSLGLKSYSIHADSTILFHALGDTKANSTIHIGDDGVLFFYEDIAYWNSQAGDIAADRFDRLARKLAALQARLAAQHRGLVPIITPSKTSIYPDQVPERWTRAPGAPRPTDELVYRRLRAALDAQHVQYVDARALLSTSPLPRWLLWPATGRHWTVYAACLVFAQVAAHYTALTGRSLDIPCTPRFVIDDSSRDFDLSHLINAWWVPRAPTAVETVPPWPPIAPHTDRPSVVFAGTSFCWALFDAGEQSERVDGFMNYYDSTLYFRVGTKLAKRDLRATPTAWQDAMTGKDLYVLDLFESYVGSPAAALEQVPDELAGMLDTAPRRAP